MKHIFILIIIIMGLFLFLYFLTRINSSKEYIYGTWEGDINGKEVIFIFNVDSKCILNFKDCSSGEIEILSGNFKIDFSKKPVTLTIRNIPQLSHPLYTIVEFPNDDSIKVARFSARWRLRPISFNNNTTYYLKQNN